MSVRIDEYGHIIRDDSSTVADTANASQQAEANRQFTPNNSTHPWRANQQTVSGATLQITETSVSRNRSNGRNAAIVLLSVVVVLIISMSILSSRNSPVSTELADTKALYSSFVHDYVKYSADYGGYYYFDGDSFYRNRNSEEWYFEDDVHDILVADINSDGIPELFLGSIDAMGIYTIEKNVVVYLGFFDKANQSKDDYLTIYLDTISNKTLAVSEGLSGTGAGSLYSIEYNYPGTLTLMTGPFWWEEQGKTYYYSDTGNELDADSFWQAREEFYKNLKAIDEIYFVKLHNNPENAFNVAYETYLAHQGDQVMGK